MSFLLRGLISNISRLSMSQTPEISYKFAGYIPNRFRVTLSWLHRDFEKKQLKPPKKKKSALDGKPLAKGIILKNLIKKPRKPNSANRKCVLVKLSTGKEMVSYVPGEGHNLQVRAVKHYLLSKILIFSHMFLFHILGTSSSSL